MPMCSIVFICLGNICRSPIAEGVAKEVAKAEGLDLHVTSAGTSGYHVGERPCENSIKVAKNHGVDISHQRSKQINGVLLKAADIVIALDTKNYDDLKKMGAKNLYKLGDFGFEGADVPDPYFFEGFEGFERVYTMIEKSVKRLIEEKIKR